jgi:hypothetical protein
MTRKFKSLGVALAAVLAMGALVAAVASATNVTGHFTKAGETETIVTGEQGAVAHLFGAGGHGEAVCPKAHFEGKQTVAKSETITIRPTYTGLAGKTCKFKGLEGTTVVTNGCDYIFNGTKGTVQIVCPGATKSITIEGKVAGVPKCTIHIPEQTLSGITYTNNNVHPGNTSTITVTLNVTGITYTTTKGSGIAACEATTNATDGTYTGSVTFSGTAGAAAEGIWVT